jgi:hypothetical protein
VRRAALLSPIRHYLFDFTSQLSEMNGEALVKLALLHSRRASGDLLRIIGFGAQLLCAGLHVLHELYLGGRKPGNFSLASQ